MKNDKVNLLLTEYLTDFDVKLKKCTSDIEYAQTIIAVTSFAALVLRNFVDQSKSDGAPEEEIKLILDMIENTTASIVDEVVFSADQIIAAEKGLMN